MKRVTQLTAGFVWASAAMIAPTAAMADVSYNIGYASEYYFRGALQKSSSASAGADFEQGGLYLGTWAADVGDGLEVDVYGGYGIETESGFSASLGVTGYYYTGQFDDKYEEVNLNLGFGMFGLEYSIGQAGFSSNQSDYDFLALSVSAENGLYGKVGMWGQDFDGEYLELGYGTTVSEFDVGVALILASEEFGVLNGEVDSLGMGVESEALIFTIGKSF